MQIILAILLLFFPIYSVAQGPIERGSFEYYEQFKQEIPSSVKQQYREYWSEMEKCSKFTGDFDKVHFYEYPSDSVSIPITSPGAFDVVAWWSITTNSIIILRSHIREPEVVKHEMLHALMGFPGHSFFIFTYRCHIPIYY